MNDDGEKLIRIQQFYIEIENSFFFSLPLCFIYLFFPLCKRSRFSFQHLACFISCKYVKRGNIPQNILAQSTTTTTTPTTTCTRIFYFCVLFERHKNVYAQTRAQTTTENTKKNYWENVCCHEYVEQAPTEIGYIRFNAYTVYAPVITYTYIKSRKKARTNTMCQAKTTKSIEFNGYICTECK